MDLGGAERYALTPMPLQELDQEKLELKAKHKGLKKEHLQLLKVCALRPQGTCAAHTIQV